MHLLPDFTPADVCGSCFAIKDYSVNEEFGGDAALARFRALLSERGMKLMLDFVPNHTALDHGWVRDHPDHYVPGSEQDLQREPENYCRVGSRIFAHGRDPYFPGWPDTLQLNYADPACHQAMLTQLVSISRQCDGVRCDMAMLILPDIFERTWGRRPPPFWPDAIQAARDANPDFLLLAEVYWDLEWELQQQGFDYTYDKRLYDRLRSACAQEVRSHLTADLGFQTHCARFLENHDELRAAAVFSSELHSAAAVITYLSPGLRYFHAGQLDGYKVKISLHLDRGRAEVPDSAIKGLYDRLMRCLRNPEFHSGEWRLLDTAPAWESTPTADSFICFSWSCNTLLRFIVAVNYSPHRSQCYLKLPFGELNGRRFLLRDIMSTEAYDRSGDELTGRGLYLDVPAWACHVFDVQAQSA